MGVLGASVGASVVHGFDWSGDMADDLKTTDDAFRQIGRRAADNGAAIAIIDDADDWTPRERELWREGWREARKAAIKLRLLTNHGEEMARVVQQACAFATSVRRARR
jgi:hypothetical protein